MSFRFNRQELAGSLGDLGTLLPMSIALIQFNGLQATPLLLGVGLYYLLSGAYFRITMPVQPMKVVAAYAIAQGLSPLVITSSGLWLSLILLLLAATRAASYLSVVVPKPVIRGVQLTTGVMLILKGVQFVVGESSFQQARSAAEPFLSVQSLGPIPLGIIIGIVAFAVILILLKNKVAPAALVVVALGALTGLALGGWRGLSTFSLGLNAPELLPYGLPTASDLVIALTVIALPQIPMTLGNAVLAQNDLTREYFGDEASKRSSARALTFSMGLANLGAALIGGMPMCHGSGGLAAHYRFGARTAGSNVMIGLAFVVLALAVGDSATALLGLIPFSVLGALLAFAGTQLAIVILDVTERKALFVVLVILGVSMATNLAVGFAIGLGLHFALKHPKLDV